MEPGVHAAAAGEGEEAGGKKTGEASGTLPCIETWDTTQYTCSTAL